MKILGISAGRKNGNNDAICKEALMGAEELGAEVEFIRLLDLELKHCTGCGSCMRGLSAGGEYGCPLRDDFDWLKDKILDADGVVFAVPVFEKGAAGVFHTVMDRFATRYDRGMNLLAARASGGELSDPRLLRDKAAAFLGMGGTDYTTRFQCDCAVLGAEMMWTVVENHVYAWTKVFSMEEEKVAHAHQTGRWLAEAAADLAGARYRGDPGVCPRCHSRNFHLRDGPGKAVCCVCGMEDRLDVEGGRVRFLVEPDQYPRAFNCLEERLRHAEDVRNNQAERRRLMESQLYRDRQERYVNYIAATRPPRPER